ncbi:MAG: hypothetical protein LBV42_01630 [Methanobrevibacter sp.]|jgi:hypothetical protein|nr:hypothetical protein [Methanobrevibacter sp.]
MLFKKVLCLLFISVLVMSCMGGVSAKSYTYNVSCHLGDKIGVYAKCRELDVYDDYHFMLAFYHVGMFKMYWERDDLLIAQAVVPGFKRFTIINNFRPIEDNDYVNFNITEDPIDPIPPVPPVPPAPDNNSTPVNPDPVDPVMPTQDPVISVVVSDDPEPTSLPVPVDSTIMNISNDSNGSNIVPVVDTVVSPVSNNDNFVMGFYKFVCKECNDFYRFVCKECNDFYNLCNDLYDKILNATTVIRG